MSSRDDFNEIYDALDKDTKVMFFIWTLYMQLFGNQENADLLNETARDVFVIFEKLAEREAIHFICKMFESAETGKNKNLTLFSLADEKFGDLYDVQILLECLTKVQKSERFLELKKIRNTILAHSDIQRRGFGTRGNFQYESIFSLLEAVAQSLNYTRRQVLGKPNFPYENMPTKPSSDGSALINKLKRLRKIDDD